MTKNFSDQEVNGDTRLAGLAEHVYFASDLVTVRRDGHERPFKIT